MKFEPQIGGLVPKGRIMRLTVRQYDTRRLATLGLPARKIIRLIEQVGEGEAFIVEATENNEFKASETVEVARA